MLLRNLAMVACLGLSAAPALAQTGGPGIFNGTPAEQDACRRDSIRFCRDVLSDNMRVLACLQSHRAKISKACQAVLTSHGQ